MMWMIFWMIWVLQATFHDWRNAGQRETMTFDEMYQNWELLHQVKEVSTWAPSLLYRGFVLQKLLIIITTKPLVVTYLVD